METVLSTTALLKLILILQREGGDQVIGRLLELPKLNIWIHHTACMEE